MTLQDIDIMAVESSLLMHIDQKSGGIENIDEVEENEGSLWIKLKDGRALTLLVYECTDSIHE